jgi:hypothetical protein
MSIGSSRMTRADAEHADGIHAVSIVNGQSFRPYEAHEGDNLRRTLRRLLVRQESEDPLLVIIPQRSF